MNEGLLGRKTMYYILVVLFPTVIPLLNAADVIVSIEHGDLRGQTLITCRGNMSYMAFRGIPFASPPIGNLRFKDPEPMTPWTGVRDALQFSNICVQTDSNNVIGDEDCLYLNVYTPELSSSSPLPVMVWLHGGAFIQGSGEEYTPDFLLPYGVVLVTLNYRLGAFGFMSLLHSEIPGNAGLKDQVLALQWVQRNIAAFGGDNTNVTIFGQSAGAVSIHGHMLSPMSKGLFQRVILESGSLLSPWCMTSNPISRVQSLANILNCPDENEIAIAECLRNISAVDIQQSSANVLTELEKAFVVHFPFTVVVDGGTDGIESFLPDDPVALMNNGSFNRDVPILGGVNSAEALFTSILKPEMMDYLEGFQYNVIETMSLALEFNTDNVTASVLGDIIQALYFKDVYTPTQLISFFSDWVSVWPVTHTFDLLAPWTEQSQFLYYFNFVGELNYVRQLVDPKYSSIPGAAHRDEYYYLFPIMDISCSLADDTPEMITMDRMTTMWTNFARTGNPTPLPDATLDNVTWSPYVLQSKEYMFIDNYLEMRENLKREQMVIYNTLFYILSLL